MYRCFLQDSLFHSFYSCRMAYMAVVSSFLSPFCSINFISFCFSRSHQLSGFSCYCCCRYAVDAIFSQNWWKFAHCILQAVRFYFLLFQKHTQLFKVKMILALLPPSLSLPLILLILLLLLLLLSRFYCFEFLWRVIAAENRKNAHARTFSHISASFLHERYACKFNKIETGANEQKQCACFSYTMLDRIVFFFSYLKVKSIHLLYPAKVWSQQPCFIRFDFHELLPIDFTCFWQQEHTEISSLANTEMFL